MKKIKLAVVGMGNRGNVYSGYASANKDEYQLVAIVEMDEYRRQAAAVKYPEARVFAGIEDFIKADIACDLVGVATQDKDHRKHAIELMEAGYDLLLEKPIADSVEDCIAIYNASVLHNRKVYVCHVLRYSPFYRTIRKLLNDGVIGEIVNISISENAGYGHFAHSFVRGPWRDSSNSNPIIMAKSCHDLDILCWLIGKPFESVNSVGGLKVFKPGFVDNGGAKYCTDCKKDDCVYRSMNIYKERLWMNQYYIKGDITPENIEKQLPYSQYDRCVYACDNNVCDNQNTIMRFADGVFASFYLTALSATVYRDIKINGTLGELHGVLDEEYKTDNICVKPFRKEKKNYSTGYDWSGNTSHGGGDVGMMHELYLVLNGVPSISTTLLDVSMESHIMGFAAEKSRLINGQTVYAADMKSTMIKR